MRSFFLIVFFISSNMVSGQLFGPSQLFNDDAGIVYELIAADLDNDELNDIVVVANNRVYWHKNIDGQGNFSPPIIIQVDMAQAFNGISVDIDDDQDLDIIISYFDENIVALYRNNGDGTFPNFEEVASGLNYPRGVDFGDLDGDDDNDLVLGVTNGLGFYWVENLDGNGNFSTLNTIDPTISQARTQVVKDIDGDDDLDILTNSGSGIYLSWFENLDGLGDFGTQHIIETVGLYENYIYMEDIDGDEDMDIVSITTDEIYWRENLDGLGSFGPKQLISTVSIGGYANTDPVDLDNDLDKDVVVGSLEPFSLGWHENLDGNGNFAEVDSIDPEIESPSNIRPVDLDNDGDLDLVVSTLITSGDKFLYWYENLTILSIDDLDNNLITISPNPVNDILLIENVSNIEISSVKIYDILGRLVLQEYKQFSEINVSNLNSGVLFVHIETDQGTLTKKVIKE